MRKVLNSHVMWFAIAATWLLITIANVITHNWQVVVSDGLIALLCINLGINRLTIREMTPSAPVEFTVR